MAPCSPWTKSTNLPDSTVSQRDQLFTLSDSSYLNSRWSITRHGMEHHRPAQRRDSTLVCTACRAVRNDMSVWRRASGSELNRSSETAGLLPEGRAVDVWAIVSASKRKQSDCTTARGNRQSAMPIATTSSSNLPNFYEIEQNIYAESKGGLQTLAVGGLVSTLLRRRTAIIAGRTGRSETAVRGTAALVQLCCIDLSPSLLWAKF
jgi:hypothetical protein